MRSQVSYIKHLNFIIQQRKMIFEMKEKDANTKQIKNDFDVQFEFHVCSTSIVG